jgi:hypothetical protein
MSSEAKMFDLIFTGIGYAFTAAFWVGIFFAGRAAFRAKRSRRYRRCVAFSVLIVALLWMGLFVGLTPGASAYARYRYSRELFGRGFAALGTLRHSYHSLRAFNGDGYSIAVFTTSDTLTRWATSPPTNFGTTYPALPSVRSHWSVVHWRATPVGPGERKFLEFALMEHANSKDLDAAKKLLERLANEPGHYFACYYYMHGQEVGNVDFFLLSPTNRVFISVNHNT